ncbi:MAG: transposase [Cyanobacteria bacterium P01_H01_bin.15]
MERFAEKWNEKYPSIPALWLQHWDRVIPFFDYPADIRKVIYTSSTIESVNRALRKVLKTKSNMDLSSIPAYEADLKATLGPSGCEILEQSIIKQAKTIKEKARIIFENFMKIVD